MPYHSGLVANGALGRFRSECRSDGPNGAMAASPRLRAALPWEAESSGSSTPTGLGPTIRLEAPQPRWGCNEIERLTQGGLAASATLGWRTDLSRLGKRRKEFGEAESPQGSNERERESPSRWVSICGALMLLAVGWACAVGQFATSVQSPPASGRRLGSRDR